MAPITGLRADQPYREAAEVVLAVRTREVFSKAAGVLDTTDIERVHAMRVGTRRLRAALEVFGPCYRRRALRKVLRDVKLLADALGERRDRDVQIETLEQLAAEVGAAEQGVIAQVVEQLRDEQRAANKDLARALKRAQRSGLRKRLQRLGR
jgi:CHAD domain-containing protein